jgi:hypothetical protein
LKILLCDVCPQAHPLCKRTPPHSELCPSKSHPHCRCNIQFPH